MNEDFCAIVSDNKAETFGGVKPLNIALVGALLSCHEGNIKWFNATKGFGFIVGDDGAEVFVHYRNVEGLTKRSIKQGQRVAYSVRASDRGPQAEGVKAV